MQWNDIEQNGQPYSLGLELRQRSGKEEVKFSREDALHSRAQCSAYQSSSYRQAKLSLPWAKIRPESS